MDGSDQTLGEIRLFAGPYVPVGWAACDGSTLPITGNEALFSLLNTTYGGDGITKFGLPDLRSRVPVGQTGTTPPPGLSVRSLAQTGGAANVMLAEAELPAHNHTLRASTSAATDAVPDAAKVLANANSTHPTSRYLNPTAMTPADKIKRVLAPAVCGSTGSYGAHNNMMPTIAMNYIIAVSGFYPSHQ